MEPALVEPIVIFGTHLFAEIGETGPAQTIRIALFSIKRNLLNLERRPQLR